MKRKSSSAMAPTRGKRAKPASDHVDHSETIHTTSSVNAPDTPNVVADMTGQLLPTRTSLMGLPTELRLQILDELLPAPNQPDSQTFRCRKPYTNEQHLERCETPVEGHDCDEWTPSCYPKILCVNRKLYEEGLPLLYRKTCSILLGKGIKMCGKEWITFRWGKIADDLGLLNRLNHIVSLRVQLQPEHTDDVKYIPEFTVTVEYLVALLRENGTVKDLTVIVNDNLVWSYLAPLKTLRKLRSFSVEREAERSSLNNADELMGPFVPLEEIYMTWLPDMVRSNDPVQPYQIHDNQFCPILNRRGDHSCRICKPPKVVKKTKQATLDERKKRQV